MIKPLVIILFLIPGIVSGETKVLGTPGEKGERCYSEKEQVKLDEALDLGIQCQVEVDQLRAVLSSCRKWRDKYKHLCARDAMTLGEITLDDNVQQIEYRTKWDQNTWLKFGMAVGLSLAVGFAVGTTF